MTATDDPNSVADALVADGNDPAWVKAALRTFAAAGFEVNPAGTADRLAGADTVTITAEQFTAMSDANAALAAERDDLASQLAAARTDLMMTRAALSADNAELRARVSALTELLHSVWLYIDWRYVTKQMTTPQKEMFADAVDLHADESSTADRWWRADPPPTAHNADGTESMTGIAYCTVCGEDAPCSAMASSAPTPDPNPSPTIPKEKP